MVKMAAIRVLAVLGVVAALAAGCQAPGGSQTALSFGGKTYTNAEVEQAQNELNELLPAQARQQLFGAQKVSRVGVIQQLLAVPVVEKLMGADELRRLDAQLDQIGKSLGGGKASALSATTRAALRTLLVAQQPQYVRQMQGELARMVRSAPPRLSPRYGDIDWVKGMRTPAVGGGVVFGSAGQLPDAPR